MYNFPSLIQWCVKDGHHSCLGNAVKQRSEMALWAWHFYDLSQALLSTVAVFPLILMHSSSGCYFNGFTFTLQINMMGTGWASLVNTPPSKSCSVTGFRFVYFFTWLLCICLFPSLSHHCLSRGYMKPQEQIQPPGSGAHLLSHGHGCKAVITPPLQVPHIFYMEKLSWAQTKLFPPLMLMFHLGAAVPALKLHYCHRCRA